MKKPTDNTNSKMKLLESKLRKLVIEELKNSSNSKLLKEAPENFKVHRYVGNHGWQIGSYSSKEAAQKVATFMGKMSKFESNYDPERPPTFKIDSGY